MEMTDEERSGWRAFLIEHKIAQPFVQIEEKLVGEDTLTQDRYDGPKVERYEFDELADLGLNVQYTTGRKHRSGMYFDDDGHEIFSDVPPIEEIWIECGGHYSVGRFCGGLRPGVKPNGIDVWYPEEFRIPDNVRRRTVNHMIVSLDSIWQVGE